TNGSVQVVPDFIDPEPQNVPAKIGQAARTDLVAPAQVAIPVAMVVLAIQLDIEFVLAMKESEIEGIRGLFILRDRPESGLVHGFEEATSPTGALLRV